MKRRPVEVAALAAGALFLVVLAVSFRPGRRPAQSKARGKVPEAPASDVAGEATTLLNGFDFTESVAGKPLLRIKADRTVGYGPAAGLAPNLYAGEKVTLTVFTDEGPPVTVHSERANYDERTRESRLEGNVRWTDADGSLAETEKAVFHPVTRSLEVPGRLHFTKGSIDLSAPSARYDVRERIVYLAGPVKGAASGQDSGGLSQLTARSGLFRRDQGVLELENADGQSRAGDRYAADHLTIKTGPSGGRPEWARGTGNVHGILASGDPGSRSGVPRADRQYSGNESALVFDEAGQPKSFSLSGTQAVLAEPKRRLTARRIDVGFENGRAVNARADGDVRVESDQSRARADRGSLGFGKDGAVENVTLDGAVSVDADGRKAEGARATELNDRGLWLLTGEPARSARVQSGGSRLSADRIEIDRGKQIVRGEGRARAIFSPDSRDKARRATFVGDPKRPTFGKADKIVLDDAAHLATLSGSASLWQDNSSLFADDITLSDPDKTVTAVQNVRAVLTPARDRGAKPAARAATVISARHLLYRDTDRTARFEGGVTMARGADWRASGGESTAWLNAQSEVESVEVSGDVKMTDRAIGRSATAEKALDYPRQGKTVLWGSPARVTDATGNQVAGAVLTILDRGRSVEITAPEGGKTETIHRTEKN